MGVVGFFPTGIEKRNKIMLGSTHVLLRQSNFQIRVNKLIVTICISSRTQRSLFQRGKMRNSYCHFDEVYNVLSVPGKLVVLTEFLTLY